MLLYVFINLTRGFELKFSKTGALKYVYKNNSITNTSIQQITDTGKSPAPSQAAIIPAISAKSPETGLWVAWIMAGNVITASVT